MRHTRHVVVARARRRLLLGLLVGCHPGPTATVTFAVAALAWTAGQTMPRLVWVVLAVLTGQLAVGWCNDARDGGRDLRAGRSEKPVVRGWIDPPALAVAAVLAATACVPLSYLAGGTVGGSAHVLAVASALAYDLWLKATPLSLLPWMVSFGLVPFFVTYGLQPPQPPAAWVVIVGVLLGSGAHLANAARDIASDRRAGVAGLAGALGSAASRTLAVVVLLVATAVLLVQVSLPVPAAVVLLALLVAGAVAAARWQSGRRLFEVILVIAVVDVALLLLAGAAIAA